MDFIKVAFYYSWNFCFLFFKVPFIIFFEKFLSDGFTDQKHSSKPHNKSQNMSKQEEIFAKFGAKVSKSGHEVLNPQRKGENVKKISRSAKSRTCISLRFSSASRLASETPYSSSATVRSRSLIFNT